MDIQAAVDALGALAQASRLAIFQRLVELGPDGAYPGDLAQTLDIPATTLSFHLKTLSHAGLIVAEPSGRFIRYRADFARMQALIGFLTRNCCNGDLAACVPARSTCRATPAKARSRRAR